MIDTTSATEPPPRSTARWRLTLLLGILFLFGGPTWLLFPLGHPRHQVWALPTFLSAAFVLVLAWKAGSVAARKPKDLFLRVLAICAGLSAGSALLLGFVALNLRHGPWYGRTPRDGSR